jgi:hypothetical protein
MLETETVGNQGNHQNLDPTLTNFHGDEAKNFFFSKWLTQKKKRDFQNRQFSIFFCENFMDWSLGW